MINMKCNWARRWNVGCQNCRRSTLLRPIEESWDRQKARMSSWGRVRWHGRWRICSALRASHIETSYRELTWRWPRPRRPNGGKLGQKSRCWESHRWERVVVRALQPFSGKANRPRGPPQSPRTRYQRDSDFLNIVQAAKASKEAPKSTYCNQWKPTPQIEGTPEYHTK